MSEQSLEQESLDMWREVTPESSRRLLFAAVECMSQRGFHGASTRAIAATAGMSPAAMYIHYKSKSALLYEISRVAHQSVRSICVRAMSDATTVTDQMWCLVNSFVSWHVFNHQAARVIQYELHFLDPQHYKQIVQLRREMSDEVSALLTRGVEEGVFTIADVHLTGLLIMSIGIDVARWYRPGGGLEPGYIGEYYASRVIDMLTSASDTPHLTPAELVPDATAVRDSPRPRGRPDRG